MSDAQREQATAVDVDHLSILWQLPGLFWKRRRLFLLVFACVALGAVAGTYLKRQHFESKARLLVKLEQRDVMLSHQSEVRYDLASRAAEEAVATQAELLHSDESIAMVVDQLGPDIVEGVKPTSWIGRTISGLVTGTIDVLRDSLAATGLVTKLSPREAAIEVIRRDLAIYPVRRAQLIEITFRARRSEAARQVLDALILLHLAKLANLNASDVRYEFYRKQSEQLAGNLHEAEKNLARFKMKHNVIDLRTEKAVLLHKIERLTSLLEGAQPGAAIDLSAITAARDTDAGKFETRESPTPLMDPATGIGSNELSQLITTLNQLRLERARRGTLLVASDPRIEELDSQIALADSVLARQTAQIIKLITGYKSRLALLDRIEPEQQQLQRDVAMQEENYRTYVRATEDRRISQEQQSRVILQIADKPSLPIKPFPSRHHLLLAGLGIALAAAIAALLIAEFLSAHASATRPGAAPIRPEQVVRISPH